MKKNYNSPMTEVTVIMVKSNMLIGSNGLEVDGNNNIIQNLNYAGELGDKETSGDDLAKGGSLWD